MILSIDYGKKKVGTALLAENTSIAFPHKMFIYDSRKALFSEILALIEERGVKRIVFGLPLSMDGSESDWCHEVRKAGEKLSRLSKMPLSFVDERLTSIEADGILVGKKKKTKQQAHDLISAVLILERYMKGNVYEEYPKTD